MKREVTQDNKSLARYAVGAFGGVPKVTAHYDDDERLVVDILACKDQPVRGVTSYSTLGLSDHSLTLHDRVLPFGVELCGACDTKVKRFTNVLATAAFFVMKDGWVASPGAVFETMVSMYPRLSRTLKHVFFVPPFLWDNLRTVELPSKKVTWLQVIPISDGESSYRSVHGAKALQELFVVRNIDVFDINRRSVTEPEA
jgi:hypothetical protein